MARPPVRCRTDSPMRAWLIALRERYHMNQDEWARHLGVSPSSIKRWECGMARPRGLNFAALMGAAKRINYPPPPPASAG